MPSYADFYPSDFACLPLVLNGTVVDNSVLIGFYFHIIFNCKRFSMRIRGDNPSAEIHSIIVKIKSYPP